MIRCYAIAATAVFFALPSFNAWAADPLPVETHKVLTAALAVEAAQAAIAACKAQGYNVTVTVADRTGMQKVVIVRDGPAGVGTEVTRRKAYAAAVQRSRPAISRSEYRHRVLSIPACTTPTHHWARWRADQGPRRHERRHCGRWRPRRGQSGDKDEACAIAGLDKIKDRLN